MNYSLPQDAGEPPLRLELRLGFMFIWAAGGDKPSRALAGPLAAR
jgi:hypothetical protein